MASDARSRPGKLPSELGDLLRGLSGGFLFALPVIYTMEAWWLGQATPTWKVLAFVLVSYIFLVGLNRVSGFKPDHSWPAMFKDGVEALGMSIVVAFVMLVVMGVINAQVSLVVALRMILVLAVPISIGVSLSRTQLAGNGEAQPDEARPSVNADLKDIGLTIVGGVFLGLSVAPTEEILMIATQGSWLHWLAMVVLSIVISYVMIFVAHFTGQMGRLGSQGIFQKPWVETIVTYAVSLLVAFGLLAFLGFTSGGASWIQLLTMTVTLGLPTTLGGAAARLLL